MNKPASNPIGPVRPIRPVTPSQLAAGGRARHIDPPLPGLATMAKHAAATAFATTKAAFTGKPIWRTEEEAARVKSICTTGGKDGAPCQHFRTSDQRCSVCGCGDILADMWKLATKHCPLKPAKW